MADEVKPVESYDFDDGTTTLAPPAEPPAAGTQDAAREARLEAPSDKAAAEEANPFVPKERAPKPQRQTKLPAKPDNLPATSAKAPEPELGDPDLDEPEPSAESADEPGDLDETLIHQAQMHGMSEEDARALGPSLERTLLALDRREVNRVRQAEEAARQQAAQPKTAAPDDAAKTKSTIEKYQVPLDPKEYDEATISALNGMNDHYSSLAEKLQQESQAQIAELRGQLDAVLGNVAAESDRRFADDMDGFFSQLPEEFGSVFGKDKMDSLAPQSKQAKARVELVNEMKALSAADHQLGRGQTPVAQLQQRALRLLHADTIEKQTRAEIGKKVSQRRGQAISRPSPSRAAAPKNPEEAAIAFAKDFYRNHAYDFAENEDEI